MTFAPVALRPALRRRPWGGERLAPRWPPGGAEREVGPDPFGEAWLAGPDTRVFAGPWAGSTLGELTATHGAALIGTRPYERYGDRFPLLLKLLDAAEPLSLQVHPDDAYALSAEAASGHLGKTEAWWVVHAEPGAEVWWGFARTSDRVEVARAAAAGTLATLLRTLPVATGDVVVNPAGTVHALGAGMTVFEVQQASDLTYRLDDHGRVGPDGRPRALHIERALDVADFAPGSAPAPAPRPTAPGRTELARTHAFVLERLDGAPRATWSVGPDTFDLITSLGAEGGRLTWAGGSTEVAPSATWLLPAGLGQVSLEGGGPYARVWVPSAGGDR